MTYLELCRKLAREAEITASETIPSAVTGQSGQLLRVVGWVKDAWVDIQNRRTNWRWMKRPFSFNTVADDGEYASGDVTDVHAATAIARFGRWHLNDGYQPPLAYLQSSGVAAQYRLLWQPLEVFRSVYGIGAQTSNQPVHITVDEQNNILLGPKPNAVYVVTGFFYRSAQELEADGDTPEMPAQFHDLVWREAIQMYAANSVAPEVFARATREAGRTLRALELNQLPPMEWPESLA